MLCTLIQILSATPENCLPLYFLQSKVRLQFDKLAKLREAIVLVFFDLERFCMSKKLTLKVNNFVVIVLYLCATYRNFSCHQELLGNQGFNFLLES